MGQISIIYGTRLQYTALNYEWDLNSLENRKKTCFVANFTMLNFYLSQFCDWNS